MLLQPTFFSVISFVFWSWWTPNFVVSDPQIQLLFRRCSPSSNTLPNLSIFHDTVNATLRDIKEKIITQNKYFSTVRLDNAENSVYTLFQCRNYISITDCVSCFKVAANQTHNCSPAAQGAGVVYDRCFLRYETNPFFEKTTEDFNAVSCGNNTVGESIAIFTSVVEQVLKNLQTTTPKKQGFFAATKTELPNKNGTTIYAFAQCIETISQSGCFNCLNTGFNNMRTCLSNSDGRAYADGCFMRYSTYSFFPHNYQITDVTSLGKQDSTKQGYIIGGVVGGVAFLLILFTIYAWIRPPKTPKKVPTRGEITGASKLNGPVTYSYKELKAATKNFSQENKIGEGGFGVVYKGTLENGKVVAIKKLNFRRFTRMDEGFESEVKLIRNVRHGNLIQLLGCCSEGHNKILVYEYMKNNSLDKFLFGKKKGSLNWKQRCNIILGTAKGLAYLHEEFHVRVIHRDIKTNNILLDENLLPKIADFGLARLLPEDKSHISTKLAGTLGYAAPEYVIHGQLSEKADIYSYGVVVLEIISGQKCREFNVDGGDEGAFLLQKAWKLYQKGKHLELVDKTVYPNGCDEEEVMKIIEIGLLCTQASPVARPMMSEVVVLLQNRDMLDNMKPTMPILIETN